jgi:hypothetical protein
MQSLTVSEMAEDGPGFAWAARRRPQPIPFVSAALAGGGADVAANDKRTIQVCSLFCRRIPRFGDLDGKGRADPFSPGACVAASGVLRIDHAEKSD